MRDIFHDGPDSYDIREDLHIDPGDGEEFRASLGYPGPERFIECSRCGCRILEPRFWIFIECPACHRFIHNEE